MVPLDRGIGIRPYYDIHGRKGSYNIIHYLQTYLYNFAIRVEIDPLFISMGRLKCTSVIMKNSEMMLGIIYNNNGIINN